MTQASEVPACRYRAFISYSHQDKSWADWLHKALETYRVPSRLVGTQTTAGTIPRRLAPIFRDRDELASATDLGRMVNEALGQSANLIVICSPRSASSRWVNEEVLAFKRLGRSERVFCLIVDGEPNASELPGRESEECFAPALRFRLGTDNALTHERTEPIAADARAGKDGKTNAKLKLIAGMLDIGFDALKRREQQRRTRRMTALATIALIVMAVTTTLAITAVIARNAAERRQKQAEGLVDFMLGDLGDKLAQVQRLDIMEAVDDQAMRYFQSLPATDLTDEALMHRSKALKRIGSVRMDQGHLDAAMTSFRTALPLAEKLANNAPNDIDRQLAYAEIWAFIGKIYWYQGQLNLAQQGFESAQKILERAESRAAGDLQLQYQLTMIDNNIGHVLEARGRLEEAALQYQKMLALCQRLVEAKPDNTAWAVQLGASHNNVGKLALLSGDLATAIAQYAADNAIESRLSAQDPKNNDQLVSVVAARAILGRTLALTGNIETGMDDLQQAVDLATQLKLIDPDNSSSQDQTALYATQLGRLRRLSGDLHSASALTSQALTTYAALTKQDASNAGWQRKLAEAQLEQAEQSRTAGQADAARTQIQPALHILEPALAKQPDDRATLLAVVGANLLLASVIDDAPRAQQLRESALKATQTQKSGHNDPRLLALQVEALLALGRKAEAEPVIRQLWNSGYHDVALANTLRREQINYPVNKIFQEKLLAAIGDNARHGAGASEHGSSSTGKHDIDSNPSSF